MSMNPQYVMQFMGALNTFRKTHPKFASFIEKYIKGGVPEGTVIEVTVIRPGEEPVTTNMKVQQSDIDLIQALKNME